MSDPSATQPDVPAGSGSAPFAPPPLEPVAPAEPAPVEPALLGSVASFEPALVEPALLGPVATFEPAALGPAALGPAALGPAASPARHPRRLVAVVGVCGLVAGLVLGAVVGVAAAGGTEAAPRIIVTPSPVVTTAWKVESIYVSAPPAATTPATTAAAAPAAGGTTAPPPAAGPVTSFGDGTYEVNVDIAPGTYKTKVPASESNCYWERMRDFGGGVGSILANDNAGPGSPITVKIAKSDAGFKSSGCGTWSRSG